MVCSADFFKTSPSAMPIFFKPSCSASLGMSLLPLSSTFEISGRSTTTKVSVSACCDALISSNRPVAYKARIAFAIVASLTRSPAFTGNIP